MGKSSVGYTAEDFGDDYWLTSTESGVARADRDGTQVATYFNTLFNLLPSTRGPILDIGAGVGHLVFDMQQAGINASGCEFSPSGRRIATERFGIELSSCNLKDRLPYATDQFAWSYCNGVLSMIPHEFLAHAVSEILRVAKWGTLVMINTYIGEQTEGYPHHITGISSLDWWRIFKEAGAYDWTALLPPQRQPFGLGVATIDFAALFSKSAMPPGGSGR